jgi:hypothetical protein
MIDDQSLDGDDMTVRIKIGNQEHDIAQADSHWIISQIKDQQSDTGSVCVQIVIKKGDVDLQLRSAGCPSTGGGSRQASQQELRILELWEDHSSREKQLNGGEIIAFLNQLKRIL